MNGSEWKHSPAYIRLPNIRWLGFSLGPKRKALTEECGQRNGPSFNSSVRIPLSILNGLEPDRLEMALNGIDSQEHEGRRMALNGNSLLLSYFC